MACLDAIVKQGGDMSALTYDEKQAVREVADAMLDDIRSFDFTNATPQDVADLLGYAYNEICAGIAKQYGEDIPF